MNQDQRTIELCALFSIVVRAMVKNQDAVVVKPIERSDGVVVLTIRVAENELGKLIGQGGRIARSLRLILLASVREHGELMPATWTLFLFSSRLTEVPE